MKYQIGKPAVYVSAIGYIASNASMGNTYLRELIGIRFSRRMISGTAGLCTPPVSRMLYL